MELHLRENVQEQESLIRQSDETKAYPRRSNCHSRGQSLSVCLSVPSPSYSQSLAQRRHTINICGVTDWLSDVLVGRLLMASTGWWAPTSWAPEAWSPGAKYSRPTPIEALPVPLSQGQPPPSPSPVPWHLSNRLPGYPAAAEAGCPGQRASPCLPRRPGPAVWGGRRPVKTQGFCEVLLIQ